MPRYHYNAETGRANICKAEKQCPLGDNTPHFDNKEDAKKHVEKTAKEQYYDFKTIKKTTQNDLDALNDLTSVKVESAEYYLHKNLPEFKIVGKYEQIDYKSSYLVEKDGNHYILGIYEDTWNNTEEFNGAIQVKEEKVEQYKTTHKAVNDTKDYPEINDMVEELNNKVIYHDTYTWNNSSHPRYFVENNEVDELGQLKVYKRDDGTEVISFNMQAEGDRTFLDAPNPISSEVDLYENDERQNARSMQQAYGLYDTRTHKGIIVRYDTSSEGEHGSSTLKYTKENGLTPAKPTGFESSKATLFIVEGTGETQDTIQWKMV